MDRRWQELREHGDVSGAESLQIGVPAGGWIFQSQPAIGPCGQTKRSRGAYSVGASSAGKPTQHTTQKSILPGDDVDRLGVEIGRLGARVINQDGPVRTILETQIALGYCRRHWLLRTQA
jgi:hypothetical protein